VLKKATRKRAERVTATADHSALKDWSWLRITDASTWSRIGVV